jgi:hypothetical protein
VDFDGLDGDEERLRDLLVRSSLGRQLRNPQLACPQRIEPTRRTLRGLTPMPRAPRSPARPARSHRPVGEIHALPQPFPRLAALVRAEARRRDRRGRGRARAAPRTPRARSPRRGGVARARGPVSRGRARAGTLRSHGDHPNAVRPRAGATPLRCVRPGDEPSRAGRRTTRLRCAPLRGETWLMAAPDTYTAKP